MRSVGLNRLWTGDVVTRLATMAAVIASVGVGATRAGRPSALTRA